MKNKKGFTLIELLAVIVVLAIIALIATPIIMNVINDAKKGAAKDSVYAIIAAAELEMAKGGMKVPVTYTETDELSYKGTKPDKMKLDIDKNGKTNLVAFIDGYCVVKEYGNDESTIDETKKTADTCVSGTVTPPVDGPKLFATDSWNVIANAVKAGNTSVYKVGDTKEVTLTGEVAGTYTVRIANNSTPAECNGADFSETACGFVVEFVDIISKYQMNATATNVGGWPASEMRTYINNTIYNALPTDLKSVITDTKVVSSHGNTSGETNLTSTDKLYLLATKEVWGKAGISSDINYDTSDNQTRQLDYYKIKGVTTSNYSGVVKQYNGSNSIWWLRSAYSNGSSDFFDVNSNGNWSNCNAYYTNGVAPSFRIG